MLPAVVLKVWDMLIIDFRLAQHVIMLRPTVCIVTDYILGECRQKKYFLNLIMRKLPDPQHIKLYVYIYTIYKHIYNKSYTGVKI